MNKLSVHAVENEKKLEEKFREAVKKAGGIALKFSSSFYDSWPDRFVLMPGGRFYMAECKTTGKKPTKAQSARIDLARAMGHTVFVIDSTQTLNRALYEMDIV